MTDPYIPAEAEMGNVRKALSSAYQYGYGFAFEEKSDYVQLSLFD